MDKMTMITDNASILIRPPVENDAAGIWRLVENSPVLDRNSYYCYFLLCKFFSRTCAVAECGGEIIGFLSAFTLPESNNTLFLWQTAVAESFKRRGIGLAMMINVLQRCPPVIDTLLATIYADNISSQSLFSSLARALGSAVTQAGIFITPEMFPIELKNHETEILFRIGPVSDLNKKIAAMAS